MSGAAEGLGASQALQAGQGAGRWGPGEASVQLSRRARVLRSGGVGGPVEKRGRGCVESSRPPRPGWRAAGFARGAVGLVPCGGLQILVGYGSGVRSPSRPQVPTAPAGAPGDPGGTSRWDLECWTAVWGER